MYSSPAILHFLSLFVWLPKTSFTVLFLHHHDQTHLYVTFLLWKGIQWISCSLASGSPAGQRSGLRFTCAMRHNDIVILRSGCRSGYRWPHLRWMRLRAKLHDPVLVFTNSYNPYLAKRAILFSNIAIETALQFPTSNSF